METAELKWLFSVSVCVCPSVEMHFLERDEVHGPVVRPR